jgi:hypothetical protein
LRFKLERCPATLASPPAHPTTVKPQSSPAQALTRPYALTFLTPYREARGGEEGGWTRAGVVW